MLFELAIFISIFIKPDPNEELGHLYILKQIESDGNIDDWSGKINATNSLIKQAQKSTNDKIQKVEDKIQKIEEKQDKLLELFNKFVSK